MVVSASRRPWCRAAARALLSGPFSDEVLVTKETPYGLPPAAETAGSV